MLSFSDTVRYIILTSAAKRRNSNSPTADQFDVIHTVVKRINQSEELEIIRRLSDEALNR